MDANEPNPPNGERRLAEPTAPSREPRPCRAPTAEEWALLLAIDRNAHLFTWEAVAGDDLSITE